MSKDVANQSEIVWMDVEMDDDNLDDEITEQLLAHAVASSNGFVRHFHRQASEELAANRIRIARDYKSLKRKQSEMSSIVCEFALNIPNRKLELVEPLEKLRSRDYKKCRTSLTNSSRSINISKIAITIPKVPSIPNSTVWSALTKNYDAEDEPILSHIPYFGDDDNEDIVSDVYQVKMKRTSKTESIFTKELCGWVIKSLQMTWDLTKRDLLHVSQSIEIDPQIVLQVHKEISEMNKATNLGGQNKTITPSVSQSADAQLALKDSTSLKDADTGLSEAATNHMELYESRMDSFRQLFCRSCCVYDCEYHGCTGRDLPKLVVTEQNAIINQQKVNKLGFEVMKNCGNQCFLGQLRKSSSTPLSKASAISTAFGWKDFEKIACARAYFICSGNFCEVARILGNKTCLEVAEFCDFYDINDHTQADERKVKTKSRKSQKKKKIRTSHLLQVAPGLMTTIPTSIVPCGHAGPCEANNGCSCIGEGRLCSKLCYCIHSECKIYYEGCRCARGRCRTNACPCYASGRECNVDACTTCCSDLLSALQLQSASLEHKYSIKRLTAKVETDISCKNRNITYNQHKRLRVGRSQIKTAGWGCFTCEYIEKDEFVVEYLGEMISQEEAERRGTIYDKVDRSYLFNLDSRTVVDATRKGNKSRFINHSSAPNCCTKILNVKGDYRIGIFALTKIEPDTELFFDYRYEQELKHKELHKKPNSTPWM